MSFRITSTTIGQQNPSPVDQHKPYEWRGTKGWRPEQVSFRERGPSPMDQSPGAIAARNAAYREARDAGKTPYQAIAIARISAKTARRIEQERQSAAGQQQGGES